MAQLALAERITGALTGAAIGAELGFARLAHPERFAAAQPTDLLKVQPAPAAADELAAGWGGGRRLTPFIALGVRTYLTRGGRATPEDFGALLKDDEGIAAPAFCWDGVHTVQELLKEGMNPRLSGLGNAPCGLIAAAMPAVGIYHFADPEYAYLDGVELASVAQPRLGADWAALGAAAVAAALAAEATPAGVVQAVLKLAHENNPDLFYQLNQNARVPEWMLVPQNEGEFLKWWFHTGARTEGRPETNWVAFNPIHFVLPLLRVYGTDAGRFMAVLLGAPAGGWFEDMVGGHAVSAVLGGAVLGALNGPASFPAEWRATVEPTVAAWQPLSALVRQRAARERELITITERLAVPRAPDQPSVLFDKVCGCILAGAIGNAMGSPVEGQMYWEIDKHQPQGVTTVLDPRRLEGEDDNQMAMLLTETYIAREGRPVLARHFGKTWCERLNRDHFFPLCMGNAYDLLRQGWDPRITGHWSVVTGSTVMCMEPVGTYHLGDPEFAAIDATAISYLYQRGLDVAAATMMAATVAEAFRPEATVDSVCQAALTAAPSTPLKTFDRRPFPSARAYLEACLGIADKYTDVRAARKELYDKCLLYHMIDPLELWGFALAMFRIARGDVRQAAIGGTNIGRDSDTIAGRAAMLAGTLKGAGTVPADWIALFKPEDLDRIHRAARRITELLAGPRLARLQRRQAAAGGATDAGTASLTRP